MKTLLLSMALSAISVSASANQNYIECDLSIKDSKPLPSDTKRSYITHTVIGPNSGHVEFGYKHTVVDTHENKSAARTSEITELTEDVGWILAGIPALSPKEIRNFLRTPSEVPQNPPKAYYLRLSNSQLLKAQEKRPIKFDYLVQAHYSSKDGTGSIVVARELNWIDQDDTISLGLDQPSVQTDKLDLLEDNLDREMVILGMAVKWRNFRKLWIG